MFVFDEEYKWRNIVFIAVFFLLGIVLIEPLWSGLFVFSAMILSRVIAKEEPSGKTFFDAENLVEFNSNYYFAFYRMLLSGSYIFVAFGQSYQFTLDVGFFLLWFVGYTIYWYTTFFIPSNGELTPFLRGRATTGALISGISLLSMFAWIVTHFKEFAWFSSIITEPLAVFF